MLILKICRRYGRLKPKFLFHWADAVFFRARVSLLDYLRHLPIILSRDLSFDVVTLPVFTSIAYSLAQIFQNALHLSAENSRTFQPTHFYSPIPNELT